MTEKLFRWVKAVERLPQVSLHLPVRIEGVYYLAYFEGCDMSDHYIFSCFDNHDRRIDTDENRDMIEWLEPYTPSLNAGSLEEAAKAAAQESWDNRKSKGETEFASAVDYIVGYVDGFLAGAAYVKGGEENAELEKKIEGYKIALWMADVPKIIIDHPELLLGLPPNPGDIKWAEEAIQRHLTQQK